MTKNKGTKDKDINELSNHKPRRGRPIGAKNQKKKSTPQPVSIIDKSQDIMEIIDVTPENYNLKGELTERELKFIQIYLSGGMSLDNAMILAGFGSYSQDSRYYLARKITEKYECQGDDHRKIFRAVGAGETAIAQGLLTLAQTAKSEMVRLNAWTALAKCLGLTKEVLESVEGIQIVINSSRGLGYKPKQHRPAQVHSDQAEAPVAPPGPLQVTR